MRLFSSRLLLAGAALMTMAAFAPAQNIDKETKADVLKSLTALLSENAFVPSADFGNLPGYLEKQKEKIDAAGTNAEFQSAVNSALREFGISHCVLFTPEMATSRRENASVGIGILVQQDDEGLLIVRVMPNSPAAEAGLEPGDKVIIANGKKPEQVTSLLGKEGDSLTVTVKKFDGKQREIKLVRRKFSTARPETLSWVDRDTAILNIPTFDLSYDRERVEALMKEASGSKNLILDLRSNPGGAVINMTHLLSMLLPPESSIGTFVSKRMVSQYVAQTGHKPDDLKAIADWTKLKVRTFKSKVPVYAGKLAVLVNGGSGSASEITAAALKETLNAPIIGQKSAGMVLVSVIAQLPHGFQVQYPVTDFVTKNGVRLEGNGVAPDVEAADPRFFRAGVQDEPVEKALALLTGKGAKIGASRGATAKAGS